MRVCLVTSVPIPPEEGIGYYVWNLAQQLVHKGHSAQIITRGRLGRGSSECLDKIAIWRPTFAPLYPFHVHFHGLFVNRLVARLEHQVDIFHVHTPLPPVVRTARPVFLTVHTPMRADTRSIPLRNVNSLLVKLQLPVSYRLEHRLLHSSTQVTAVARSVANELREYGISPAEVTVLGNGVDHERFTSGGADPMDPPYILSVGRLGLRKGLEDLVECARLVCGENPGVQFCIAGKGPLEAKLKAAIHRAGLEGRVLLLGHVADRTRMVELYRQATLFVHPAHYEGLPTVLLEAMACGRPVVATAVSGALDVITPGENGMLVPPREPKALAEALLALLGDPTLRHHLGQNARKTVEQHYSWDVVSEQYLACYEQVVNGQG